jgi:hypothetical protein
MSARSWKKASVRAPAQQAYSESDFLPERAPSAPGQNRRPTDGAAILDAAAISLGHTKRVAIAQDKAFSFYYRANRLALEKRAHRSLKFSPLADSEVPDLLYVGVDIRAAPKELEANASVSTSVRHFIESAKVLCRYGGFSPKIDGGDGRSRPDENRNDGRAR